MSDPPSSPSAYAQGQQSTTAQPQYGQYGAGTNYTQQYPQYSTNPQNPYAQYGQYGSQYSTTPYAAQGAYAQQGTYTYPGQQQYAQYGAYGNVSSYDAYTAPTADSSAYGSPMAGQPPQPYAPYGAYNQEYNISPQNWQPPTHSAFQMQTQRKRKRSPSNPYDNPMIPKRQVRISNLPHSLFNNPNELARMFSSVGRIMCMNVPHHHDTGNPRNYAFVKFSTPEEASRACAEFNGKMFDGHKIGVLIANKQAEFSGRTNTIQVENLDFNAVESQIRQQFSKHGEITNFRLVKHSLSGRATAIIEYRHSRSVQSALNEYHKDIYVGEAIDHSHDSRKRRKVDDHGGRDHRRGRDKSGLQDSSNSEVYVGKLPPQLNSNKEELKRIFEPFGHIENVDIVYDHSTGKPKGTAYIRYQSPNSARQACQNLNRSSYYGHSILVQLSKRSQQAQCKTKIAPSGDKPNEDEIFIANLPSKVTENDIRQTLCQSHENEISTIHMVDRPPSAFVKFSSQEAASKASLALNDKKFRDRVLSVRLSLKSDNRNGIPESRIPSDPAKSSEVHIGNMPYEHCNENTIRKTFSICGPIEDVRLPTPHKHSRMPRGFAFVKFEDRDSALRALGLHGKVIENRAINVSFPKTTRRTEKNTQVKDKKRDSSPPARDLSREKKSKTGAMTARPKPSKSESSGPNFEKSTEPDAVKKEDFLQKENKETEKQGPVEGAEALQMDNGSG